MVMCKETISLDCHTTSEKKHLTNKTEFHVHLYYDGKMTFKVSYKGT